MFARLLSKARDEDRGGLFIADPANSYEAVDSVLHAVRRLAKADRAYLIGSGRQADTLTVVGGTSALIGPEIIAAVKREPAVLAGEPGLRWIALPGRHDPILVVQLTERRQSSFFLALAFSDSTAVVRARVAKVVPDLVVLLRLHLDLETQVLEAELQRSAAAIALDHGECGVIAVSADHKVVFANTAGRTALSDGGGLCLRRGVVGCTQYSDTIRFHAALDAAVEAPRVGHVERSAAFVMLLSAEKGRRPKIVVVLPTFQPAADGRNAVAIIRVLDPVSGSASRLGTETICHLHGLSRVETRLVGCLCAGLTMSEAAAEMRLKVETARTYLKQIFAKTGAHRQTDLLMLVNRYLRAMPGDFLFETIP